MQSAREKISNMASAAKEHVGIYKAKVEEKLEKAAARTEEEKKRAEEGRKAKEAEARKELHEVKAWHAAEVKSWHAAEKLSHKQAHLRHHPAGHHDPPLQGFTATAATAAALVYGQNEPAVGTHGHHHPHQPVGTANPMAGATAPTYPRAPNFITTSVCNLLGGSGQSLKLSKCKS